MIRFFISWVCGLSDRSVSANRSFGRRIAARRDNACFDVDQLVCSYFRIETFRVISVLPASTSDLYAKTSAVVSLAFKLIK